MPTMVATEGESRECCKGCGGRALHRCSRCQGVKYCSKECQQKDWSRHKTECRPKKKEETETIGSISADESKAEEGPCNNCSKPAKQKCSQCKKVFYCKRLCLQQNWDEHKNDCYPFKIECNDVLGRYAVATRAIKAGEVIIKETPLAIGPLEPSVTPCLGCYKPVDGSYRCKRCGWWLCGAACESSPQHSGECSVTRAAKTSIETIITGKQAYNIVIPLRCLAMREDSEKLNALMNFQSTASQQDKNEIKKQMLESVLNTMKKINIKYAPKKKKGDTLKSFIELVMGVIDINGFEVIVGRTELMGLYPKCSMLEHSCIPNTKHKFNSSHQLVLKAAVDIAEGEHLSTTYTKILWGTTARRKNLLEIKYFLCNCRRCADPTELGTYFSALKCTNCTSDAYMLPKDPLNSESEWNCNKCSHKISSAEAEKINVSLEETVEREIETPTESNLEKLITESTSLKVHPNHYHLFKARHTLLQLYGRTSYIFSEDILKKKEKMCQDFLDLCLLLDPGLARLGPYAGVAYFEFEDAIMMCVQKMSNKEYPDEKKIDQGITLAKSLLQRCIKALQDEPDDQPQGKLRVIAQRKLTEISLMTSKEPKK